MSRIHEMSGSRSNSTGEIARTASPISMRRTWTGVEDQPVVERATTEVDPRLLQPPPGCPRAAGRLFGSQRDRLGQHLLTHAGLERVGGHDVHIDADDLTDLAAKPARATNPTSLPRSTSKSTSLCSTVAACDAAEHPNVARSAPSSSVDHGPTMATKASTERCVREPPTQGRRRPHIYHQFMARRLDELGQHRQPRLASIKLHRH